MRVVPVTKQVASLFVEQKHYSRRSPIYWAGFGLEEDGKIEGVVVYGQPSPPLQRHAFEGRDWRFYELSRLVIQTETKNAASFLVGNSLRMLPAPCAVVSFADSEYGHCGIVYQSTNWLYTGATKSHDKLYIVDGKRTHPMTLRDRGITDPMRWARENGIEVIHPSPKHRYFQFVGSRSEKRRMEAALKYPVIREYPKGERVRYDDGPRVEVTV